MLITHSFIAAISVVIDAWVKITGVGRRTKEGNAIQKFLASDREGGQPKETKKRTRGGRRGTVSTR